MSNQFWCSKQGCSFVNKYEENIRKHERWLCNKARRFCKWGCNKRIKNVSLLQHYANNHVNDNQLKSPVDEWQMGVLNEHNSSFLYQHKLTEDHFHILVVSVLPAIQTQNYIVVVEILDMNTGLYLTQNLVRNTWENENYHYDFYNNFSNDFTDFIDEDDCYKLRLSIRANCQNCELQMNLPLMKDLNHGNYQVEKYCRYECPYGNTKSNVFKHEKWFCRQSENVCNWCCDEILYDTSRFTHFKDSVDAIQLVNNSVSLHSYLEKNYAVKIAAHGRVFICRYLLTTNNVHIMVASNLRADLIRYFQVEAIIFHRNGDFYFECTLACSSWERRADFWDYTFNYSTNLSRFGVLINDDDSYEIKFFITRVCVDCV